MVGTVEGNEALWVPGGRQQLAGEFSIPTISSLRSMQNEQGPAEIRDLRLRMLPAQVVEETAADRRSDVRRVPPRPRLRLSMAGTCVSNVWIMVPRARPVVLIVTTACTSGKPQPPPPEQQRRPRGSDRSGARRDRNGLRGTEPPAGGPPRSTRSCCSANSPPDAPRPVKSKRRTAMPRRASSDAIRREAKRSFEQVKQWAKISVGPGPGQAEVGAGRQADHRLIPERTTSGCASYSPVSRSTAAVAVLRKLGRCSDPWSPWLQAPDADCSDSPVAAFLGTPFGLGFRADLRDSWIGDGRAGPGYLRPFQSAIPIASEDGGVVWFIASDCA